MAKTVVIDPGHGGSDPGAVGNGLKEKDLTLDIAKRIQSKLKKYNIKVIMTRTTDKYLSLTERANIANKANADMFISIHINAGAGTGFESFIYNGGVSNNTKKLQQYIHNAIIKQIGVTDRGKKRANFAVVRQTKMPAVLTENMFIDSDDAKKLKDSKFLDKIAQGHVDGIVEYFKLNKTSSKPKSSSKPSKTKKKPRNTKKTTNKASLKVDGKWGKSTTKEAQKSLGTVEDGIISSQPRNSVTNALYNCVTFGSKGSPFVRALQKKVGANVDGKLGPETIRKSQKHLGTPVDGVISRPSSTMVKELQRRLNAGTF